MKNRDQLYLQANFFMQTTQQYRCWFAFEKRADPFDLMLNMPAFEKQAVTNSIYSVMSANRTFVSNLASVIKKNSYIYQSDFSAFYSLMGFRK